jgi:D-glycero-alpha-D-manno-heptose-7-phosphate kinase
MAEQTTSVACRAPTRIDLGGGWTDVPPFSEREGGFVCNVAITRYATARLSPAARPPADRLLRTVLAHRRCDFGATIESDFPVGAGLGGSSAAMAALLGAIAVHRGETIDRAAVAELGRRIEVEELGVPGGRQDHYAATHGGALALTFGSTTTVERIALSDQARRALVEHSILLYTGESRVSGDTITAVIGAYERGDARVVRLLERMRGLAQDMAAALARGDVDAVGSLVREHWEYQRALHPGISTPRIDTIVERALADGARGAKAMGASGGGCVFIMCPDGRRDAVARAVRDLGDIIDFDVDTDGLTPLSHARS